ncbi:MAG: DUF2848 domain-containing protein [Terriglobia bacterium]
MRVSLAKGGKLQPLDLPVKRLYCVGYAGRNQAKVKEHIDELAKIGVAPPARTPAVYPVSPYLLTDQPQITVQGKETSGEVEFVIFIQSGKTYVAVGSDHTDRELEKTNLEKSKQMCEKPVANLVWDFEEVQDHWDSLILRAWFTDGRDKNLYQQGQVTALLPVADLVNVIQRETDSPLDGAVVYSGTVPTRGGFICAKTWDLELEDPVLKRSISHHYEVTVVEEEMKR